MPSFRVPTLGNVVDDFGQPLRCVDDELGVEVVSRDNEVVEISASNTPANA